MYKRQMCVRYTSNTRAQHHDQTHRLLNNTTCHCSLLHTSTSLQPHVKHFNSRSWLHALVHFVATHLSFYGVPLDGIENDGRSWSVLSSVLYIDHQWHMWLPVMARCGWWWHVLRGIVYISICMKRRTLIMDPQEFKKLKYIGAGKGFYW